MEIDPTEVSIRDFYLRMVQVITPRAIAWVSSQSAEGNLNLAPFSFFTGIGANPPTVVFCPVNNRAGRRKDSLNNIEETGEFVVNVVSWSHRDAMNQTSAEYPAEVSEFEECGLTPAPSKKVKPPRVKESLAHMECELFQTIHLAAGPAGANLVIGEIVLMEIDDSVLDENGGADAEKLDTIGRLGGASYTRTTDRFDLPRPELPSK